MSDPMAVRSSLWFYENECKRLEAERDRLAEALRTYGTHKTGCTMNALQKATAVECVCGLADALRDVEQPSTKWSPDGRPPA